MTDHYRVGPGKCICGFDAYQFTGIMLDYHELLMSHLREAPKRDQEAKKQRADAPPTTDHAAEILRITARTLRLTHTVSDEHYHDLEQRMDSIEAHTRSLAAERAALLNLALALAILAGRDDKAKGHPNHTINWLRDGHPLAVELLEGTGSLYGP